MNRVLRAVQHVERRFALWHQQKELLKILIDNQREAQSTFSLLDSESNMSTVKMQNHGKGPYQILEKAGEISYKIQKIPNLASIHTRPGNIFKEAVF
jgi:hypothetical protein